MLTLNARCAVDPRVDTLDTNTRFRLVVDPSSRLVVDPSSRLVVDPSRETMTVIDRGLTVQTMLCLTYNAPV